VTRADHAVKSSSATRLIEAVQFLPWNSLSKTAICWRAGQRVNILLATTEPRWTKREGWMQYSKPELRSLGSLAALTLGNGSDPNGGPPPEE
jgi:hypothetical protein